MEQQTQQPTQPIREKTENKPPIKTNWKFVRIVAVLGLVVGGGIVWHANLPTRTSNIIVSNETPVNNYNYEESRPMYQCIKDNDCMLVKDGYCGMVISINKAYQTAWTEQDKINSEQARKNRQTCKDADRESLDINNYTSSCYNLGCNVKARQSTQTDKTAIWQTYRNDEFGFEFQYPTDWFIKDIFATSASPFHLAIDPSPIDPHVLDAPVAAIQIYLNRCWKKLEKYPCQNTVSEAVAYRSSFISEETLKEKAIHISGKDGVQVSGINKSDQLLAVFYTDVAIVPWDNDEQLMIELGRSDFEDIYNQILSTFRFVE